jgi:2-polyprenyl-3-methyl-5-hydroxy-6-metoxy-1,4-benzoquinol methylase
MNSFKQRSTHKELIDDYAIPFTDIKRNMQELDFINQKLGGHVITLRGFKQLVNNTSEVLHVVEIGCGGGDNLRVIRNWAKGHGLMVALTGIDINAQCIAYAESLPENGGIQFICSDYRDVKFSVTPDVVFSSLFCHHFTNEELIKMLHWMKANSRLGFFINDLHRHPMAYYSIKLLTQLFSKSYLVKNDAPLSVKRGFTKKEWRQLFAAAGILNFQCQWKWAFRWLIISPNNATAKAI